MTQLEDNATKSLSFILNTGSKVRKKLILDFLVLNDNSQYSYEEFIECKTQEKQGDTIPDLILYFKNRKEFKIEVKDKNSTLTKAEKEETTRDLFLIPKEYKYENEFPENAKIKYWEDLFDKIDEEFNGQGFDEMNVTRFCLGIKSINEKRYEKIANFMINLNITLRKENPTLSFEIDKAGKEIGIFDYWFHFKDNDFEGIDFESVGVNLHIKNPPTEKIKWLKTLPYCDDNYLESDSKIYFDMLSPKDFFNREMSENVKEFMEKLTQIHERLYS